MSETLSNWLENHLAELRAGDRTLARQTSRWVWARLGAFALLVGGWWPLQWTGVPVVASVAVSLGLFAFAVVRHRRLSEQLDACRAAIRVADESSRRVGGQLVAILSNDRPAHREIGGAFIAVDGHSELSEHEIDDLDLYARPIGLFGLLNRASTGIGQLRLREYLEKPLLDAAGIAARQEGTRWLAEHHDRRLALLAPLSRMRGLDVHLERFARVVAGSEPFLQPMAMKLLRGWTLVSIVMAGGSLVRGLNGDTLWWFVLAVLVAVNFAVLGFFWPRVRGELQQWEGLIDVTEYLLDTCAAGGRHLSADGPEILAKIRRAMVDITGRGTLAGALPWLRWSTSGGFIQLILNAVGFYDSHMLDGIQRHVIPSKDRIEAAIAAVAELEAMLSLGCFAAEEPSTAWPGVSGSTTPLLEIRRGYHPLLGPDRAVANDVRLDAADNLLVITGSNMSGKSTFLRMIGVNVLLAQAGSVVCAEGMEMTPVRLMTDLRIRDNLGKGESYFLAEVRGLRRLVSPETEAGAVLGLIDEPFRGTNHQEQHAATLAITEHLHGLKDGMYVLATHDRDVARTAAGHGIRCQHFAEELHDGAMTFDYRLKEGIAQTRNALRVLAKEGYPPSVVERAIRIAETERED